MATAMATIVDTKILAKVVKLDDHSDLLRASTSSFYVKYDYIFNFMILFGSLYSIYVFDNSIDGCNYAIAPFVI